MKRRALLWLNHSLAWLEADRKIFLIEFDSLKTTHLRETIRQACLFLTVNCSDAMLDCSVNNKEGHYHRQKTENHTEHLLYDDELTTLLQQYKSKVNWYLKRRCPVPPICVERSQVDLSSPP